MNLAVEAVLFVAGKFIEEDYIAKVLQLDKRTLKKELAELREHYEKRDDTALRVTNEGTQWKLTVRDEYLSVASKLVSDTEIQGTVLETLAVIAWKNPIMQSELIKIRGPAGYEHIAELVERGFVTKVPDGRTFKLTLQEKFFNYFDVEGREDMRKLFSPVEAQAAAQQAEIDAKQAEYDRKVQVAQQAVSGEDSGVSVPAASSEHSAQDMPPSNLVDELREAAKMLGSAPLPQVEEPKPVQTPPQAVETEEQRVAGTSEFEEEVGGAANAVDEFGKSVKKLEHEIEDDSEKK
jgi:segregation and condensation protein B